MTFNGSLLGPPRRSGEARPIGAFWRRCGRAGESEGSICEQCCAARQRDQRVAAENSGGSECVARPAVTVGPRLSSTVGVRYFVLIGLMFMLVMTQMLCLPIGLVGANAAHCRPAELQRQEKHQQYAKSTADHAPDISTRRGARFVPTTVVRHGTRMIAGDARTSRKQRLPSISGISMAPGRALPSAALLWGRSGWRCPRSASGWRRRSGSSAATTAIAINQRRPRVKATTGQPAPDHYPAPAAASASALISSSISRLCRRR